MKPFLSGRSQSSTPPLQSMAPPLPKSTNAAGHHHGTSTRSPMSGQAEASPTVECVKQGDKVVRLIVTCTCGQRIEVDCLYPGLG